MNEMAIGNFPENLISLHAGEEDLYQKSIEVIREDARWLLHLEIIELAMDMTDVFRQYPTDDEDLKVIQMLSMRIFNAFAASIKLMLSGYYQNSALIMRDILETIFLLDFFRTDRSAITKWRFSDKQTRLKEFKPVAIRESLDKRDGFTGKKRAAMYDAFSELAGHPNMKSVAMLRPKGMDARNCPFVDPTMLEAVLSEMGRLAVQVGEILDVFFPVPWAKGDATRMAFNECKSRWIAMFYGSATRKTS